MIDDAHDNDFLILVSCLQKRKRKYVGKYFSCGNLPLITIFR